MARPARLRRGVDRRAPLRRLRDHRQSRAVHRRRGGAHQAHQARNRRRLAALPQPDDGGRPPDAARPPDARARDVRRRPGTAAFGRHHARHRSAPAARHDGRGSRRDHPAPARRGGDEEDRLVRAARRPAAARSVQPAASGDRGGSLGLSLRTAHRRALGNLHALPRCDQPGRLQRPRPPLGHLRGDRAGARADGRPRRLAHRRPGARGRVASSKRKRTSSSASGRGSTTSRRWSLCPASPRRERSTSAWTR